MYSQRIRRVLFLLAALLFATSCENLANTDAANKDATLSQLTIMAGGQTLTLYPEFIPPRRVYRVYAPPGTTSVLFQGIPSRALAQISPTHFTGLATDRTTSLGVTPIPDSSVLRITNLQPGWNWLRARIIAEDGETDKFYSLSIIVEQHPITLTLLDDQKPITEQDTTNGRTFTFSLSGVDLSASGLSITIPLQFTDSASQIGAGTSTSLSFTAASPTDSFTLTGRSTDDGNTVNEQLYFTPLQAQITGTQASLYKLHEVPRYYPITVVDDDATTVTATPQTVRIDEGDSLTIDFEYHNPRAESIVISPSGEGLSFSPSTIYLSNTSTTGSISVTSTENSLEQDDRYATINLGVTSFSNTPILPSQIKLLILDDD
ncbi:MAG: hypothetical protein MI717_05775 [Spirochaetales bacterium]|nr:hypothetical protein [Spirochaetales bacterium]